MELGLAPKQAMAQTGSLLWGAFTGALVDMRIPSQMVVFKKDRPLCTFRFPFYDMIITVSEARAYDRASKRIGIKAKGTCEYNENGTGMLFDLNMPHGLTKEIIDFDIPTGDDDIYGHKTWLESSLYA